MTPDPADVQSGEFPEFERRVDRALKRLPAPTAPPALLTNVMRAIDGEAAGALAAPPATFADEWPVLLKIGLSAIGAAIVMAALLAWPLALDYARTAWYSPAVVLLRTAISTIRPMVPVALMYVTAMCVVAAAAASMLKHVALGGATNQ
jgi:hypothetical protein